MSFPAPTPQSGYGYGYPHGQTPQGYPGYHPAWQQVWAQEEVDTGQSALTRKLILSLGISLLMALGARFVPIIGSLHAVIMVMVGVMFSLSGRVHAAACVAAYIAGAEVLWRMCKAPYIFWEFGKYGVIVITGLGLLRSLRGRPPFPPIFYILLAVPSIFIGYMQPSKVPFYQHFSNFCAGPMALMLTAVFAFHIKFDRRQIENLLVTMIGPILGIASICFFTTVNDNNIVFNQESNFQTSGGFGPNQVSSVVGLGVLVSLLLVLRGGISFQAKVILMGMAVFMAAISALTFSRSGVVIAAASLLATTPFMVQSGRTMANYIFGISATALAFVYLVFPVLDQFTGGKLGLRFQEHAMSNREDLMMGDVKLFLENPLFGIGMGQSEHKRQTKAGATHSEITRMLAEQGMFGATGLVTMAIATLMCIKRQKRPEDRIVAVAFLAWGWLFMFSNAMRIVAPMFLIGLSFAVYSTLPKAKRGMPSYPHAQAYGHAYAGASPHPSSHPNYGYPYGPRIEPPRQPRVAENRPTTPAVPASSPSTPNGSES